MRRGRGPPRGHPVVAQLARAAPHELREVHDARPAHTHRVPALLKHAHVLRDGQRRLAPARDRVVGRGDVRPPPVHLALLHKIPRDHVPRAAELRAQARRHSAASASKETCTQSMHPALHRRAPPAAAATSRNSAASTSPHAAQASIWDETACLSSRLEVEVWLEQQGGRVHDLRTRRTKQAFQVGRKGT